MIREALTSLARQDSVGGFIARAPLARDLVSRVVGGEDIDEVIPVVADLADRGFHVALEHVEPGVSDVAGASHAAEAYRAAIDAVAGAGLAGATEVVIFTESLGQGIDRAEPEQHLDLLAAHARERGVPVRLGTGPIADVAQTLGWARTIVDRGDAIGVTLPAILRATERYVGDWADRDVRLVKGAHGDGAAAYRQPIETDKAYVRSAKVMLRGSGHPSFATHDPRLIEIVESLAARFARPAHSFEFAFYLGRQVAEQERLLALGHQVRIYVPFGHRWLERLVGGLAEQPAGIAGALRSLLPV